MTSYPRIPTPPDENPDAHADGFALLAYTIREGFAPLVSAARLARAEQAAMIAGARRKDEHPGAVSAVAQAKREIAGALRRAVAWEQEQHAPEPQPEPPAPPVHEGNSPTHPAPYTRPPAPAARRHTPAPVAGGTMIAF